jgi:hypothetical protein
MAAMRWSSREEMVALGCTLLNFCWQGTVVAVGMWSWIMMTSRATSKIRYVVAVTALTLMPAVVVGTFAEKIRMGKGDERRRRDRYDGTEADEPQGTEGGPRLCQGDGCSRLSGATVMEARVDLR